MTRAQIWTSCRSGYWAILSIRKVEIKELAESGKNIPGVVLLMQVKIQHFNVPGYAFCCYRLVKEECLNDVRLIIHRNPSHCRWRMLRNLFKKAVFFTPKDRIDMLSIPIKGTLVLENNISLLRGLSYLSWIARQH